MKPESKSIIAGLSSIVCLVLISCTSSGSIGREVLNEYQYTFEPSSIIQSITDGNKQMFVLTKSDLHSDEIDTEIRDWDQSKYLTIVDAFHKFVWNESVDNWILNSMSFSQSCDQVGRGFQNASFSFIKNDGSGKKDSVIEHQIDIYPNRKLINSWEFLHDTAAFRNRSIQTISKLTANDTLTIAERNGGLEARTKINNSCEISVLLSPNARGNLQWTVLYSPEILSVTIDPVSGKIVK